MRVFFLIIFLFSTFLKSQSNDNLRVSYLMEIHRKNTYNTGAVPSVECFLYSSDGKSKFNMHFDDAEKKYPNEMYNLRMSVYKDFYKNEMYGRAVGYRNNEYVIKDSLDIIEWKLQDSVKNINGKKYKFATSHWRDHEWEVWYDEEIPVSDGPYKLHGLPGLIVEAKATACNSTVYVFQMKSLEVADKAFLDKKIYFPFTNEGFKFISYEDMYKNAKKAEIDFLKNSHLKALEDSKDSNIVHGKTCVSSVSFDFCFCYP